MLGLITVLAIVAVALLGVDLWLWWWFPRWQMRSITAADPKDRADIEDNFRKTIGQALGGIAVLIAAGIAYYGTCRLHTLTRTSASVIRLRKVSSSSAARSS